ncbi:MAG: glycerophosphodiester phosphodiesterase family protein [Sandaracinaceae bacterium]|nr:glycerophosphodiester phosphodiesterase family protein [Sandaracinaceae bacterium]
MRNAALLGALFLVACDGSPATDAGVASDAGSDAGAPFDAGPPDAGAPVLDPALFDCTAPGVPDRASPRTLHCGLDPACTERLVSAHRGAGAPGIIAPEDTLSGIRAAIAVGADMTECDARASSDGTIVLMHDGTVDRTTTGTGNVSDLTLAELQALTIRSDAFFGDYGCEQVPTLADAIATAAGRITLIVEPKTDRIDLVVQTILDAGALDGVILDVSPEDAETALAIDPGVHFFIRPATPDEVAPLLARFTATPPSYVHIGGSMDPVFIAAAHDAGQRVFVLGFGADINAELTGSVQPYVDLWDLGIQILQTNRPDRAVAALE